MSGIESLAKTLQEKAHIEGKIDALTSMSRARGVVVGRLPIFIGFILYQQQPGHMSLMFTEWYGWIVLAGVQICRNATLVRIERPLRTS